MLTLFTALLALLATSTSGPSSEAPDVPPDQGSMLMVQSETPRAPAGAIGEEPIVIAGVVVEGGVECPLLRTDDGREFTLAGFRPHLMPVGTQLRLRGHILAVSPCRQGTSFRTLERLD